MHMKIEFTAYSIEEVELIADFAARLAALQHKLHAQHNAMVAAELARGPLCAGGPVNPPGVGTQDTPEYVEKIMSVGRARPGSVHAGMSLGSPFTDGG